MDHSGQPKLSFRGSTQVFSDTELAIWVRDPNGGLVKALPNSPRVTLLYRDAKTRATYQFYGRGRLDSRDEVRNRVYGSSPEIERNFDPDRRGVAVIVELDRVEGMGAGGRTNMVREDATLG